MRRKFEVHRDDAGVPHITAPTWLDALYGLGHMHAVDRGTQILFARAVAGGEGAGRIVDQPELLETDRFFRRVGLHLNLARDVDALDDRTFQQLTAYCQGVNHGFQSAWRTLPMWATGFYPEPWNQAAVLLVGKLLSFGGLAVSQLQNERLLVELIHAGAGEEVLRELFGARLDSADFALLRQVTMSNQLSSEALELISDLPRLAGSNAWAVSPARSATGHALLAGDPHLEVNRLPAIWYEVVLRWGDRYVMGATLPGCPLLAVARTERLAWGVTYMKGDTVDYFIEDCRPGGATGWQYRRGSAWRDFARRDEVIERKGGVPQLLRIYESPQGAIDGDLDATGPGLYLAINWAGRLDATGKAIATWLDLVHAPDVAAGMKVARQCPQPTLCFVLADRQGHIGLQGCGQFPRRARPADGLVPLPAWDETNHWQGWLPPELLPQVYDPPEGFVVTANEEIDGPPGAPLLVTQLLPDYRQRRIAERLRELPAATVDDMQALQYDLLSVHARAMLEVFLPHLPDGDLKQRLQDWDLRYHPHSREAALFQRLYVRVIVEVFGHEESIGWRRMLYLCTRAGYSMMVLTAADRLLRCDASPWWRNHDKGALIRRAAEQVRQLPDVPWSEINNFHFTDRFLGTHQVGRLLGYNSRRYPMPGCHATPFQGHVYQTATREQTFAPSYHFVTDLGTDEAWTNLPGGPSESRFSRHYKNDLARWLTGQYKRLQLS